MQKEATRIVDHKTKENAWAKALRERAAGRTQGGPSPVQIGGVDIPEAVVKAVIAALRAANTTAAIASSVNALRFAMLSADS